MRTESFMPSILTMLTISSGVAIGSEPIALEAPSAAKTRDTHTRQLNPRKPLGSEESLGNPPHFRVMTSQGVCSLEITKDKQARCKETGIVYSGKVLNCKDLAADARDVCEAANKTARKGQRDPTR